jgi:hypothetical protein
MVEIFISGVFFMTIFNQKMKKFENLSLFVTLRADLQLK